ncbi:MAG: D-glycero-beta-D-manno-heptose 1-phosphate adenylyltransferase [Thermodesulfobacteriota bacterium]
MNVKILAREPLTKRSAELKAAGKRIVFTNGCFDLLHVGHVRYLTAARSCGDRLVVGLNSDASVRRIKGDRRPITPQNQRAEVLAGLACVDFITVFEEPDPLRLIQALQPDVLIKGADWAEADIIGADVVRAGGGRVERIEVVPGASTSGIIRRILERYANER